MDMTDLRLVTRRVPSGVSLLDFRVVNGLATIGRGTGCDWVLPDPQRLLSKRHCEIAHRNGRWTITDLSSNGTTVSGRTLPPGVPVDLQDGDRIGIGSFEIDVTASVVPRSAPLEAIDTVDRDATIGVPRVRVMPDDPRDPNGRPPRPVFDVASEPGYGRGAVETVSIINPFDIALGAENSPLSGLFDPEPQAERTPRRGDDAAAVPTGLHDVFQPPRPASDLLPEDWASPLHEPGPTGSAHPLSSFGEPPADDDASMPAGPGGSPVGHPATRHDGMPQDRARFGPSSAMEMEQGPTPPLGLTRPQGAQSGTSGAIGVSEQEAIAAFMRGAGLPGVPDVTPERFFEDLGQAFRAVVVGLRRAMIARAEIKGEFRIDRTMIQPFGNNPLKFAVDDDDALAALVGVGRRTGVPAADAVAEALRDIQIHEMAVTRAIEPAMRDYMDANGPNAVLSRLSLPPDQVLSLFRRARAWSTYVDMHQEAAANVTETLDGVFGRAFARAYEAAREEIDARMDDRVSGPGARETGRETGR